MPPTLGRWLKLSGLVALLVSCAAPPATPAPTLTPLAVPSPPPATAAPTPASASAPETGLSLWLPPQFAPTDQTPGGPTLAKLLDEYAAEHSGLTVTVRPKAEAGPGGLLQALLATYNAAPAALPDLIALNTNDLNSAASAGVVLPLAGRVTSETLQGFYPFAQTLGRVQGEWLGLPFAADARVLVYNPEMHSVALRWTDMTTGTLVFPGAEAASLTVINDYLSAGGATSDASGLPALDPARLTETLTALQILQKAGVLSVASLNYADPLTAWRAFRDRRATMALTTAHWYLAEASQVNTAAALPPNQTGTAYTLAEAWSWALVNKPTERAPAVELLQWLTDPGRMGEWTLAAQMLPTRTGALSSWDLSPYVPLAAEVLTRAQPMPPNRWRLAVSPLLQQALIDVLTNKASPQTAANVAAQALANQVK